MSAEKRPAARVQVRRRRPGPLATGVIVLVLLAGGWAFVTRPWQEKPVAAAAEQVAPGPATRVLAVNGRIEAASKVNMRATVSGQVRTVAVAEGDTVTAGDVLATLDDAQQQAAVSQASAALESAQAQLVQAQTNYERAKSLGDSISQRDLDTARVAVQTAQKEVDRLTAAQTQAQRLLDEYTIRAPIAGTVLTRSVDPGQVINASTDLFSIADLDHLLAEASIDEVYSAEIRRGLPARLQPSGYNRHLEGEVRFVAPTVDPATGGRLVRIDVRGTEGLDLPIGLTVNINIEVEALKSAITVPRAAVLEAQTAPAVLVVEGGRAVRRAIEFVDWPAGRLVVTSGLNPGDVVVADSTGVKPGALVTPTVRVP